MIWTMILSWVEGPAQRHPQNHSPILIPPALSHVSEASAWNTCQGGEVGFLNLIDDEIRMQSIVRNLNLLSCLGLLEKAIVEAFTGSMINNRLDYGAIEKILAQCDRAKLYEAGSPPCEGPWTVFRGIGGAGASRRVRGYSWTLNLDTAKWFAKRYALKNPVVLETKVTRNEVLFYTNERNESEMVLKLPPWHPVKVVARF